MSAVPEPFMSEVGERAVVPAMACASIVEARRIAFRRREREFDAYADLKRIDPAVTVQVDELPRTDSSNEAPVSRCSKDPLSCPSQ
jgi:hypothetical protein